MKLYTRTGDDGTTGLFGGERVAKTDPRVEAYGTVDELNAVLGVARAADPGGPSDELLGEFQAQLFALGAGLATTPGRFQKIAASTLNESIIAWLEARIDETSAELEPLRQFILPTGSAQSAALHHARTVCRRAERCVLDSAQANQNADEAWKAYHALGVVYLNRLGDLLFVLARRANKVANVSDVPWRSGTPPPNPTATKADSGQDP